jgi:hypothetical protein
MQQLQQHRIMMYIIHGTKHNSQHKNDNTLVMLGIKIEKTN